MPLPAIRSSATAARLGACLVLLAFAGCAAEYPEPTLSVTSPPAPAVGSAPIAAYDAYALEVAPLPPKVRADMVAIAQNQNPPPN